MVFSMASVPGRDSSMFEPKTPCSRLTPNATTATTAAATISVHHRVRRFQNQPCTSAHILSMVGCPTLAERYGTVLPWRVMCQRG